MLEATTPRNRKDGHQGASKTRSSVMETRRETRTSESTRRPLQEMVLPNDLVHEADARSSQEDAPEQAPAEASSDKLEHQDESTRPTRVHPTQPQTAKLAQAAAPALTLSNTDANDFLARAKAMGLNLTLQDYERARAGVSAFLRAERVNAGASSPSAKPAPNKTTAAPSDSQQGASRRVGTLRTSYSAPQPSHSNADSSKRPGSLTSQLSFFTAVVPSPSPEKEKKTLRPRLDDVSSLIERRMRREKRKRLRDRLAREASDAECELAIHRRKTRTSSASALIPFAQSSPTASLDDIDASPSDDMTASGGDAGAGVRRARSTSARVSLSSSSFCKVGSSSGVETLFDFGCKPSAVSNSLKSPVRLYEALKDAPSPTLTRLSRKAYIDEDGVLTLLKTPTRSSPHRNDARSRSQEVYNNEMIAIQLKMSSADLEDESPIAEIVAAGEMDTDDSGVCIVADKPLFKKGSSSRSPISSHRRRISSFSALPNINGEYDGMSFLDRVMAHKRSPRRLRREARAREHQARFAAQNDLVVMAAMTGADSHRASLAAEMPPPAPLNKHMQAREGQDITQAQGNGNDFKTVRWANEFGSPRKRMTTKEIYDFEFYGIAPAGNAASYPVSSFGGWEQVMSDANISSHQQAASGSATKTRFASYGSPISARHASNSSSSSSANGSPNVMALAPDERGAAAHPMRRGLLFGNATAESVHGDSNHLLDGALGDVSNVFSQGPTLASSPVRKSLEVGETPPRHGLMRANTMAATPMTLAHAGLIREQALNGQGRFYGSPERAGLLRSRSTGDVRPMHSRKSSLLAPSSSQETDENVYSSNPPSSVTHRTSLHSSGGSSRAPIGWAHRSPMGKAYPTISPLAIFGLQHAPHFEEQVALQPGASRHQVRHRMRTLEKPGQQNGQGVDGHSREQQQVASDNEGDDERDGSPVHRFKARPRAPSRHTLQATKGKQNGQEPVRVASQPEASAFGDSPLLLQPRDGRARVVPNHETGLSVPQTNQFSQGENGPLHTSPQSKGKGLEQRAASTRSPMVEEPPMHSFGPNQSSEPTNSSFEGSAILAGMQMEWPQPDGSRLVRLISEELEHALKSGTVVKEPPPRFYRLPPNAGNSTAKPQSSSYAGMIGQAILSSSDGRLSLNEIYNWIATVYPFFERGDRGWQNSIRHNLSLNKSFMKVEREAHNPGKGGLWAIKPGHEMCFRAGNYFAPGSAKSTATAREAFGPLIKMPKTPHNAMSPPEALTLDMSSAPGDRNWESQGAVRRKRHNSERSQQHEHGSDSEEQRMADDKRKTGSRLKRAKSDDKRPKRRPVSRATSPTQIEAPLTVRSQPGTLPTIIPRVGLTRHHPAQFHLSDAAGILPMYSPREYNLTTPNRPYQARHMDTNSSEIGSAYASSVMASMPLLTDASSPPSSPQTAMPPPAGGIHGASNTKSAQKRRKSGHFGGIGHGNVFGGPSHVPPPGFFHLANGGIPANMFAAQQGMHSSPMAIWRDENVVLTSEQGLPAAPGAFHQGVASNTMPGSPTRHTTSPSRLLMQSPPVSSVRSGPEGFRQRSRHAKTPSLGRSPSKLHAQHSPIRGSPLRPGGPLMQPIPPSTSSLMSSPAGMSMQMALTNTPAGPAGSASTGMYGMSAYANHPAGPEGEPTGSGVTPMTQRFSYASPSPSRRLLDSSFSPAFATPNMHAHAMYGGTGSSGLDDPFGYSGHLQHELDLASMASDDMMQHNILGAGPSPMKGFYAQNIQYDNTHDMTAPSGSPARAAHVNRKSKRGSISVES